MKKVILITAQFPYRGGEQFLETEIQYYKDIELTILPRVQKAEAIEIPKDIIVDNFLIENTLTKNKFIYLLKSLKYKLFYKELFSENFLNIKKFKIFLSSLYTYQMYYEIFDSYFRKQKETKDTIVYTYWNTEATYALQSLKDKYNYTLISRIHGGDLYQERREFNYIPLKKYFTKNIDTLYTITQSANSYLKDSYGFSEDILKLSRLGVQDRNIITKSSAKNSLNIVSCSSLIEVKQVSKIIKSLKVIALQMKNITFTWTHIGEGILYNDLVLFAKKELDTIDNIKYTFVGNYPNEKVYKFYLENEVDIFMNVSSSEGVPVSIMEAMSCHIPIIAPDIGGMKDMLKSEENGLLLSSKCSIEEIVTALSKISFFKKEIIRGNAYKVFLEKYNADKNYTLFVENIKKENKTKI